MTHPCALAVRWTVGDVSAAGYDALALSIAGAQQLFDRRARYIVYVNTVDPARGARLVGDTRYPVAFVAATRRDIPAFLRERLDENLAEGAGWKFAPLRVGEDQFELALDNDCILWAMPDAIRAWLNEEGSCLVAEDVRPCFGRFSPGCGDEPRNLGIRGLAPQLPYARMLREVLGDDGARLDSELDEQGLQLAALTRYERPLVVRTTEVTICSPFPPHQPGLGTCGAHFVGLNAHSLPWSSNGRPAAACIRSHWEQLRREVAACVGR
jgi:hypothetical protein